MHGLGLTSFTYFPLSVANPREAPSLVAKAADIIAKQKASGKLPPGLAEQYDIQLATLKSDTLPDLEVACFPGFLTSACACDLFLFLSFFLLLEWDLTSYRWGYFQLLRSLGRSM